MQETQEFTLQGGKYEMSIDNVLIPAQLLGDISINYEEGMRERSTQAGTIRTPSGTIETAEMTFTLFFPNADYLKNVFPENYNEPTGTAEGLTGNLIFGGSSCVAYNQHTFNIHPSCEANDANDWHFSATVNRTINPTFSGTDNVSFEITASMQYSDAIAGFLRFGTGDLTQESKWDVATQTTVAA